MFDHLFKGYFLLDLAERKGRAFQMVVEEMAWRQEEVGS